MRILFCAPFPVPSTSDAFSPGASRKIRLIISALLQLEHKVVILNSSHTNLNENLLHKKSWSSISVDEQDVPVFNPPKLWNRRLGKAMQALLAPYYGYKVAVDTPIDLVWIYNSYLFESRLALALYKKQNIPFIFQIEDLPLVRQRSLLNIKPKLDAVNFVRLCKYSSFVLAINSIVLDQISLLKPKENVVLFPPIVDPEIDKLGRSRTRPFQDNTINVGYFGGLSQEKGVEQILRIVDRVDSNYKFHIGGAGPLEGVVARKAVANPYKVNFYGFMSDQEMRKLLCNMDILLNPHYSISEMGNGIFPFKVIEYIATGSYVITTSVPFLTGTDFSFFATYDGSDDELLKELIAAPQKCSLSVLQKLRQEALNIAGYERAKQVIKEVLQKS